MFQTPSCHSGSCNLEKRERHTSWFLPLIAFHAHSAHGSKKKKKDKEKKPSGAKRFQNKGTSWNVLGSLGNKLPMTSVHNMCLKTNDILAVTHAAGSCHS